MIALEDIKRVLNTCRDSDLMSDKSASRPEHIQVCSTSTLLYSDRFMALFVGAMWPRWLRL